MLASWYDPGDTKKRRGRLGSSMPYPRVIPHSDAAGVIDLVGEGVDARLAEERVWVYGAQSYRAFGTAAQYTVVPGSQAVRLPDHLGDELGACLGIPGITAHRAVFADGPVDGWLVLVHGVLGGVGSLAAQLARWGGATVIGTVRRGADLDHVDPAVVSHTVALDSADPATDIRPLLSNNVTLRLLGSDDLPTAAKRQAARDLTAAAAVGALTVAVRDRYTLDDIAEAHDRVDAGGRGRVVVAVP